MTTLGRWVALLGIASVGCVRSRPVVIPTPAEPEPSRVAVPGKPAVQGSTPTDSAFVVGQQGAPAAPPVRVVPPAIAIASDSAAMARDATRGMMDAVADSIVEGPAPDSAGARPIGPSWDINVRSYESTPRVVQYIQTYSGPARERIAERLERGTRYEPMIRQQLRAGGLPEDMYYLALVESGFDVNASSSSAAVGIWQFMATTAREMGLRVDWWMDERRDPVRSTGAAVSFLKGLDDQFGSLYLAAAAYNGGPVKIAQGLTRYASSLSGTTGDDLFFALADKNYLKAETRDYVPQLIAAALVAKDPQRFGVTFKIQPPFAYDSARVGPYTPLGAIARASGVTVADIQELNPQLLRGMTPPKDSTVVRIPVGSATTFDSTLAGLAPDDRVGAHTVTSKTDDTMAGIAKRAGITTAQLNLYNPSAKRLKSGNLVSGQPILVPTAPTAAAAVSAPAPAPVVEHQPVASPRTHVVVKGENLNEIAKKYGTTAAAIMEANGLKTALIAPGQLLALPKKKS